MRRIFESFYMPVLAKPARIELVGKIDIQNGGTGSAPFPFCGQGEFQGFESGNVVGFWKTGRYCPQDMLAGNGILHCMLRSCGKMPCSGGQYRKKASLFPVNPALRVARAFSA